MSISPHPRSPVFLRWFDLATALPPKPIELKKKPGKRTLHPNHGTSTLPKALNSPCDRKNSTSPSHPLPDLPAKTYQNPHFGLHYCSTPRCSSASSSTRHRTAIRNGARPLTALAPGSSKERPCCSSSCPVKGSNSASAEPRARWRSENTASERVKLPWHGGRCKSPGSRPAAGALAVPSSPGGRLYEANVNRGMQRMKRIQTALSSHVGSTASLRAASCFPRNSYF